MFCFKIESTVSLQWGWALNSWGDPIHFSAALRWFFSETKSGLNNIVENWTCVLYYWFKYMMMMRGTSGFHVSFSAFVCFAQLEFLFKTSPLREAGLFVGICDLDVCSVVILASSSSITPNTDLTGRYLKKSLKVNSWCSSPCAVLGGKKYVFKLFNVWFRFVFFGSRHFNSSLFSWHNDAVSVPILCYDAFNSPA